MERSESEKIIQKYSKRPIDLKNAKKIIYQYNRNQLNLASVEYDDNYSNKSEKLNNNNNIISEKNKNINIKGKEINENIPDIKYNEIIVETPAEDWNKVSKIVNNYHLSIKPSINNFENVKKEEINYINNNFSLNDNNKEKNNEKSINHKFDDSKNKISFNEIQIDFIGTNKEINSNQKNKLNNNNKLKEDFQITKLEIIGNKKTENNHSLSKNNFSINLKPKDKKDNFIIEEPCKLNILIEKDENIPTSIDTNKEEKLDKKNILKDINSISHVVEKVNIQISNCDKIEINKLKNSKNIYVNNDDYLNEKNPNIKNKEDEKGINSLENNNDYNNIIKDKNLFTNININIQKNKTSEDKNQNVKKEEKDLLKDFNHNNHLFNNNELSPIVSKDKLFNDNNVEKKEQIDLLDYGNNKEGKYITFRKEEFQNTIEKEKNNKKSNYQDMLFGIDKNIKENKSFNLKKKNNSDNNFYKIEKKEEKKVNMKELNNYLDKHMKINNPKNNLINKEEYDFFSESHKNSIIKDPNNVDIQFFKDNKITPKKKDKKTNQVKNSNSSYKKIPNSKIPSLRKDKENNNSTESKKNQIDYSEFEKHKSNKNTFEEIRGLLSYDNKSFSNIFKFSEYTNKEIKNSKIHFLNTNIFEGASIYNVNKFQNNENYDDNYFKVSTKEKIKKNMKEINKSLPNNLKDIKLSMPLNIDKSLMSYNPKTGKKIIPKYEELESNAIKLMYEKYAKYKYSPVNIIYTKKRENNKSINKYSTDRLNYSDFFKGIIYPSNNLHESHIKILSKE